MLSYAVDTDTGRQFADLHYRKHPRTDMAAWWRAYLTLDGRAVFLDLGWVIPGRRGEWTAIASLPAGRLGVARSMTLMEGFGSRYAASTYLLKLHGLLKPVDDLLEAK